MEEIAMKTNRSSIVWLIIVFISALLFQSAAALGGYRELKEEAAQYHPPLTTAVAGSFTGLDHEKSRAYEKKQRENARKTDSINNELKYLKQAMMTEFRALNKENAFVTFSPDFMEKFMGIEGKGEKAIALAARLLKGAFDLRTLEGIVLMRHPGIRAGREQVSARMNAFTQVENLDRILKRYTAFTEALMNGVGPMKGREPVNTIFPFPGITALKGEAVAQSVKMDLSDLAVIQRDAVTAMRKAFWQLIYLERAYTITSETLELFKKLHNVATTLYHAGKTSFQDVIRLTVKLNLLEDNIITIRENRLNTHAAMLALMDLPPDTPVGTPRFQTPSGKIPSLSTLYAMAHENRQELAKIRAKIGKAERMLEMAETMILPDLDAGFSRFNDTAVLQVGTAAVTPSFSSQTSAFNGAGNPVRPWLGSGLPWLEQARKRLLSLRYILQNGEARTRKMVRGAWTELDKASRKTRVYGGAVIELSSNALEVATREYESGHLTFSEVTGSYSEWLDARLSHARAVSDMGISGAELRRIVGRSF